MRDFRRQFPAHGALEQTQLRLSKRPGHALIRLLLHIVDRQHHQQGSDLIAHLPVRHQQRAVLGEEERPSQSRQTFTRATTRSARVAGRQDHEFAGEIQARYFRYCQTMATG